MSVPQRIGEYVIIDRIAVGGMAEIYVGKRVGPEQFEKPVVIKCLLPALMSDPSYVDMFLDEARLAAKLNHANIVQIYDLGKSENGYYIAMEYLIGEDLASIIVGHMNARTRLAPPVAARIAAQAAEGLHYAHTLKDASGRPLNVVHRDISPSNIVVTRDGHVKLVDFGIAKAVGRVVKTETGVIKGKLAYMAPEQLTARDPDHRVDIYALGVTLFEALACDRMFAPDLQPLELYDLIKDGKVPKLTGRLPGVPRRLEAIVERCLAFRREDRYQTALDLQRDLEDYIATSGRPPTAHDISAMLSECFGERHFDDMARRAQTGLQGEQPMPTSPVAKGWSGTDERAEVSTARTHPLLENTVVERPARARPTPVAFDLSSTVVPGLRLRQQLRFAALVGLLALTSTVAWWVTRRVRSGPTSATTLGSVANPTPTPTALPALTTGSATPAVASPTPVTPSPVPAAPSSVPAPASPIQTPAATSRPPVAAPDRPAPRRAVGFLSLESNVRLHVRAGKEDLGWTPVNRARLPAGETTLALTNPDERIEQSLQVVIRDGATTSERLRLGMGKLRIDAEPWADVYLGATKLGTTPLYDVPLWEGNYLLILKNPELKQQKRVSVTITADKTAQVRTKLP